MKKIITNALLLCFLAINSLWAQPSLNPFTTVQAENYDAQRGVRLGGSGIAVGYIQHNDWIRFDHVDFSGEAVSVEVHAASNTDGGNIEFRLGSTTGTLVGTVSILGTGGWNNFQAFRSEVSAVGSDQTLYLVFKGGSGYLFDVDWFEFSTTIPVTSVAINNCPSSSLQVGSTYDLNETVLPANADNQNVAYYTSDYSVAEVDYLGGEVTAVGPGTVTITVTSFDDGGLSDRCTITVEEGDVIATGLSINNCPTESIEVGSVYDFDVTITPPNTTNQNVAFTADDGISIDYLSGEYTASSPGTKTVYVTSFSDGGLGDECTFTVVDSSPEDPYTTTQAEDYDQQQGVQPGGSGIAVGYIENNDWISFYNMDFGSEGATAVEVRASSKTSGGEIEIRSDSPTGSLLGTISISGTGGWSDFQSFTATINTIKYRREIYLVFKGGNGYLFDVDWIRFSRGSVASRDARTSPLKTRLPADTPDQPAFRVYPNPSQGAYTIELAQAGKVQITDLMGKLMYSSDYRKGISTLDLSGFSKGVYLLSVDGRKTRLIKE